MGGRTEAGEARCNGSRKCELYSLHSESASGEARKGWVLPRQGQAFLCNKNYACYPHLSTGFAETHKCALPCIEGPLWWLQPPLLRPVLTATPAALQPSVGESVRRGVCGALRPTPSEMPRRARQRPLGARRGQKPPPRPTAALAALYGPLPRCQPVPRCQGGATGPPALFSARPPHGTRGGATAGQDQAHQEHLALLFHPKFSPKSAQRLLVL
jgi:hypothetical protein